MLAWRRAPAAAAVPTSVACEQQTAGAPVVPERMCAHVVGQSQTPQPVSGRSSLCPCVAAFMR